MFGVRTIPWLYAAVLPILASSEVRHFTPHAILPGKTTVVTFTGSDLESATNLWTSIGATGRRVKTTNSELVQFEITCPKVQNGIHAFQLSGASGVSNYQLVMVDDLRTASHNDKHQAISNACVLTPPVAVDCILKSENADYYRFPAKATESISIEVIAHRIGSEMDPVVRVLDLGEKELAFCDDEPGTWRDARFIFRPPLDAEYVIQVHDAAYGGGSKYDYRLRVTREPLTWFTFPLLDPAETTIPIELVGTDTKARRNSSPADPPTLPGLPSIPALAEKEPGTNQISVPALIHGRIQEAADVDYFSFSVNKDEKLVFQSQTRSLGSPCDLALTIKALDGKIISSSDPTRPTDAAVTNRFAETGNYVLEVRELSGNSLPNAPYRIRVERFRPGATASAETDRLELKPGASAKLKITAARYDYSGEINLKLEPDLHGILLQNSVIPNGKNDVELTLQAGENASVAELHHFRILAVTENGSAPVSTIPALRKTFPLMITSPSQLVGLFTLAIKE